MSVEVDRRVFVGSVAAGLPLLAGGGATPAFAQRQNGAARIQDPVVDQVLSDMKGAVRSLSRGGSGEHTRRLASSLRLLAAWGATQQLDARVKETIRGVVAREGRQALAAQAAIHVDKEDFDMRGQGAGPGLVRLIHDAEWLAFGIFGRGIWPNRQIFAGGLPK